VFVAKLDATGSAVVFATYLGGSFIDTVGGMALDSASNVYISGSTALNRSGFVQYPTTPGAFQTTRQGNTDAFVTKLSADGTTLLYSTFLGGTANDAAGGIAVDASGNAYVTGRALSQPGNPSNTFPITPGAFNGTPLVGNNAFVTKLSADGSGLVYSTFLVGSHCESVGQGIQVDASGNAWVTGYAAFDPSTGCDFPTTADGFTQPSPYREFDGSREFFTTKFNADGSALLFSTLGAGGSLSGILSIVGGGITLDAEANVYIAGGWAAPTPGAFQIQNPGEMPYSDAMVIKVADDHIAPTTTATPSGTPGNAGWWKSDVTVGLLAADTPLGLGVKEVTYSAAGSQSIAATTVAGNSASPVISADGQTTVSFFARDNADNVETSHDLVVKVDKQAPSILCGNPDGAWHATDVSLGCTAGDSVSGLANGADASFSLATSLAAGSESATTPTGSRGVCDVAGNCATAGPIGGNKIDKKSPTVSITAPAATTYLLNQVVAASYGCTDGGSGVASCAGTAANGASINTSSVGSKTFTVNGTDTVGNASAPASVAYKITYKVYPMYDSTKAFNAKGNATIKMQLQNAAGANRSAAGVVVTALRVSTPGDAAVVKPLSGNFTFDSTLTYQQSAPGGGYRYSLDPTGLVSGTYALVFSVPGDPVLHLLPLTIK
jgi:hypothetical protein